MRRALLGLLIAAAAFEASTAPWAFAQSSRSAVLTRLIWFDRSGQRLGAVGPIADHGNLASVTLPLQLQLAKQRGMVRPGSRVLLIGLAGGISLGLMAVQL